MKFLWFKLKHLDYCFCEQSHFITIYRRRDGTIIDIKHYICLEIKSISHLQFLIEDAVVMMEVVLVVVVIVAIATNLK